MSLNNAVTAKMVMARNFCAILSLNVCTFFILFPQSIFSQNVSILGTESDKIALTEFKSQLNQESPGFLDSWNETVHFCKWPGITCAHKSQRIVKLDLEKKNLIGKMSSHLGNLSFLQTLNLAENFFHGRVPSELGRLFRLQNLNLSFNFLEGEIPGNLLNCSNLEILVLQNNNFTGQIPIQFGSLSRLEKLYLGSNNFTGKLPNSLGNITLLQEIDLTFNNLDGEVPGEISQLENLTLFAVGANMFSGPFPSPLYNLSSLKSVVLSLNNFHGDLRVDIGLVFPNLQAMVLGGNAFTGEIPVSLSNISNLQVLELAQNAFTGNIPFSFGHLNNLSRLHVFSNNLGSGSNDDLRFLASLANCSQLTRLDISNNQFGGHMTGSLANLSSQLSWLNIHKNIISGNIPEEISNLVSLSTLAAGQNFLTGNIPASIGRLRNLRSLYLRFNYFSGEIPSSLGNLTQLLYLHLENNGFEGSIPSSLGNFMNLQEIDLSGNNINGTIPSEVLNQPTLSRNLNLSHNFLTGPLPQEVGQLTFLIALDVSYNSLSGEIPSNLGLCLSLETLYMQGNFFKGSIPDLGKLMGLLYLDLSKNKLEGKIPSYLRKFSSLQYLNLSFNELEGEVPILGVFKNASAVELNGNNGLCGGIQEFHLVTCLMEKSRTSDKGIGLKWILVIVIIPLCLSLILLLVLLRSKKSRIKSSSRPSFGHIYPKLTYKELLNATDGFSQENMIGSGSSGTVYKGILRPSEIAIAVKVLNLQQRGALKSFLAECKALRNIRHRNLVSVLTVCSSTDFKGNSFKAIVYQLMPNGSLEKWIHPEDGERVKCLDIRQRMNIAIDVASALQYLHHQCQIPVVHCDLKPNNVLLDEALSAYVSDFGLAKLLLKSNEEVNLADFSSVVIKGTIGYAAPEYSLGGQSSTEGDVYSYGILLLELFTGRRPTDRQFIDDFNLHNFVKLSLPDQVMKIVDPSSFNENCAQNCQNWTVGWVEGLLTREQTDCLASLFYIGLACSEEHPGNRLNMMQVLEGLLSIREKFQQYA
ncbi:receptor kinase At3g47110 [Olea europaea subsp. europaea]|uniref:non-specific serine/threonine protein kinase n=1 Tax=Olea europaea subsp. europaea TaxID=158383 RepID=A0A8S0QX40_OLEEU|nr:receptor kinase At3g47110 [Olea europaea subsp. europaea]